MALSHAEAILMELVATTRHRHIRRNVCGEFLEGCFPGLFSLCIRAAGELQVHEHPVVEDNHEGVAGEAEIIPFRGNRQTLFRPLDGVRPMVQLGVHRHEIKDQRTILVKPRLLLNDNRILVLDPGLEDGTAIIDGIAQGVSLSLDKADEHAAWASKIIVHNCPGATHALIGQLIGVPSLGSYVSLAKNKPTINRLIEQLFIDEGLTVTHD